MADRGRPGMCPCCCIVEARTFIRAFSIGRTSSAEKGGRVSMEPATGSFHVLSISSIFLRMTWSTTAYDSMYVLKRLRPK